VYDFGYKFNLKFETQKLKKVIFYFKLAFSKFPTDSPITQTITKTQTQIPKKLKAQTQTKYPN